MPDPATVEIHRPPNNFFDADLITELADAYERLDDDPACRAIVLCSEGKHFCAGAQLSGGEGPRETDRLYAQAVRMFAAKTPVVAAPIRYIRLRPIRSEMCPNSGMDTNDTIDAVSTATRRKSRGTFSARVA